MKTKNQVKADKKEKPLLEKKAYEKLVNEIIPVQQTEVYRKPTKKVIQEAVKELNPDIDSMDSRG